MLLYVRISILILILFYSYKAFPSYHHFPCGLSKNVMKKNMADGFAYAATAIESNMFIIQFYIARNGDWRIMAIDNDSHACNILSGMDWTFFRSVNM